MKRILSFLIVALLAGAGGWWLARHGGHIFHSEDGGAGEKKPLFYQSSMHPWIKSDKPGKCTICGMDLSPVYDMSQSFDGKVKDIVMLPEGSPKAAGIATLPAAKQPLVRTLRVAGVVDDNQTRHRVIAASVRGRVDKLHVNYLGAEVNEGEPMAELYSREMLAAISEYNQYSAGDAGLRQAAAMRLRQYGLLDRQIEELPKRDPKSLTVQILAPISGTVVAQDVYEGQWVPEGDKMFEIADFRTMWFVFDAYERDLPWLKLGQEVEITTPSHPGRVFKAPITFIDPNLDPVTRTAKVRVDMDNPLVAEGDKMRRMFLHRLYAEASVVLPSPEVLCVPRSAVLWPGGRPRVFVDEGEGAYRLTYVMLGREGDTHIEVLRGLSEGDGVVVAGGVLLDGQAQLNNSFEQVPVVTAESEFAPDVCIVSGEKLGSMGKPFVFVHEGREIELCCKACKKDFDADPAKYLARLVRPDAAKSGTPAVAGKGGDAPKPAPARVVGQEVCPVSDEKLGSMGKPFPMTYKGREFLLCCKACKSDFEAEPEKYMAKLPKP